MKRVIILAVAIGIVAGGATAWAQRGLFFGGYERDVPIKNPKYDGRFAFARIKYTVGPGGFYYRGLPAWAHGYVPTYGRGASARAEENLMKIMTDISYLNGHVEDSVVVTLDDPELFKYPVAYMTEAGYWVLNDKEAASFRAYLLKGGFAIFDDFRSDFRGGGGWDNFQANMERVIPGAHWVDLDASNPIFHSFFEINSLDIIPQSYDQGRPQIRGLYENNDPTKRLMAIANHNTDISDFWEFSGTGFKPIDESNEAYKLGVNYLIYGMTH